MKADVYGLDGKKTGSIDLPEQFNEEYEPDLIKRSILVIEAARRQAYGTMTKAGQGYSAKLSRRRRDYKGAYGKGISRVPRKTMWRRGMQFGWVGAIVPGTVGGRKAHPPKQWKDWTHKINKKERQKVITAVGFRTDAQKRKISSGKVTYKNNALIIVDKKCNLQNVIQNLPGYDVTEVKNLNTKLLTTGHENPRKCIWIKAALEKL